MYILVTGGNSGIGLALCKQLAVENKCHVFLGSRSVQKGEAAVKGILDAAPNVNVELVQIDVSDDKSVTTAAQMLQKRLGSQKLYGLVNNAGTGLSHGTTGETMVNVNTYGTKRVTEAFLPLLMDSGARIVNVGSGAGPMWCSNASSEDKQAMTDSNVTWEQIENLFARLREAGTLEEFVAYGASKAAVAAYTAIVARNHPNIISSCVTPGFIATSITVGMGASKTPEEGTVSIRHCLFNNLAGNGWFYGSDGLRSPLDRGRNPGTPAYDPSL